MKINGQKYLSSNSYNQIVIKLVNGEYIINISGKDAHFKTIKLSNDFIDTIRFLDDDNKVLEIVNHFLRNNLITGLNSEHIYRYQHFNMVNGNDRTLMLQIKNNEIGKKIVNNINQKYLLDRACYPFQDGNYMITTSDKECYYKDHFLCFKKNKFNQISEEDMKFLRMFLLSKIDNNYKTYIQDQDEIINNASDFWLNSDCIDDNFITDIMRDSNKKFSVKKLQRSIKL